MDFGCLEMEDAARKIVEHREREQKGFAAFFDLPKGVVSYDDMVTPFEQKGFLQLLAHGWLRPAGLSKWWFEAKPGFWQRVDGTPDCQHPTKTPLNQPLMNYCTVCKEICH